MAHHVWGTKRAATSLHICGILHVKKKNWIIAPIYSLGWISSITLLSSLQTTCRRESSPQHSETRGLFNRSIENIYQAFPHNKSWGPDSPRVILGCRKHQQGVQLGSQVLHAFFFHLNRSADTAPTHRLRRSRDEIVVASRPKMIGG